MSRDTLLDNEPTIGSNADGLYLRHDQPITDDFLDSLKSERLAKAAIRAGEMHRVASVPTSVIELWMRQGYDFYRMTPREIVNKLNADDLGAFVATPKSV
jgi:hypothetical protein